MHEHTNYVYCREQCLTTRTYIFCIYKTLNINLLTHRWCIYIKKLCFSASLVWDISVKVLRWTHDFKYLKVYCKKLWVNYNVYSILAKLCLHISTKVSSTYTQRSYTIIFHYQTSYIKCSKKINTSNILARLPIKYRVVIPLRHINSSFLTEVSLNQTQSSYTTMSHYLELPKWGNY